MNGELDLLRDVSRGIMVLAWVWASLRIWKYRDLPHANHSLAGSLAMVLSQAVPLLHLDVQPEYLLWFTAMAQVTLVTSFMRLTKDFHSMKEAFTGKVGKLSLFSVVLGSIGNVLLLK